MLWGNISNQGVDILVQTDLTGERLSWYLSVRGIYLLPAVLISFLGLLIVLGLLAKLKHALASIKREIADSEKHLGSIKQETNSASDTLSKLKLQLGEKERKAVDKALDSISETDAVERRFDEQSKKKLWTILKSEFDKE